MAAAQGADAPLFERGIGPLPLRAPAPLASLEAADCARCHRESHERWSRSAHAHGLANDVYEAEANHVTDRQACDRCHSPRAETTAGDPGVDCATCHVRDGVVLSAGPSPTDAHPTRADPRLTSGELCASCHQFTFGETGDAHRRFVAGDPLQATVDEWRASDARAAGRGCVDCHMREGDEVSHDFPGFTDRELLSRAVEVRVSARRRRNRTVVEAELAPGDIGHAFPTGDMFRRAVLTVRQGEHEERFLLRRWFARVSIERPDGTIEFRTRQVDDTRVQASPAPARRVELELPAGRGPVHWTLELMRLAPATARRRGLSPEETRVTVASGRARVVRD